MAKPSETEQEHITGNLARRLRDPASAFPIAASLPTAELTFVFIGLTGAAILLACGIVGLFRLDEALAGAVAVVTASESEQEHITLVELAPWLRVSVRHVERLIAVGEAPPVIRLGRRIIFNRSAVRRWLESRTVERPSAPPQSADDAASTQPGRRGRARRSHAAGARPGASGAGA